ncbi:hypothetical protein DTO166G4_6014 [Paecilomyces variotii]|nr:hypothetical protein DTO166G4_6014 [Paecilomyces variotii]KAJ9241172.1 hypothetical protein DTO166G5_1334 [Paecilomyces variotii]
MAPLTRAAGAARSNGSFNFAQAPQPASSNEPEVIEIDDDDDEEDQEDQEDEGSDEEVEDDEDEMVDDEDEIVEDEDEEDEDEEPDEGPEEETNGVDATYENPKAKLKENRQDVRMSTPDLFTSAGVQQALHPLRRTADRVTRQIEAFAEKLDRFKQHEHRPNDISSFQAAYQLVKSYQVIAEDQIQGITRQNTLKRAKSGWRASRDSQDGIGSPKTEEELKRLQLEADTWDLLLNFLSVDDPATRAHSTSAQETAFQHLHRYSTDREVWEQFLSADRFASECVIVMKWLEQTARASSNDIDSLIADLEAQAERGQGLWAHGWLYTKETIKGQKRLRAWPQPLEPDDPGLIRSLLGSENRQPLVTQLDPDAITRQKHGLEKQDQFFERATWLTCWKMLREGQSWSKIREWSQERLESWRAVSLCGSNIDTRSKTSQEDDGMTRMMNCRSHESWRTACSALAQNQNTEDFERAVYALLAGETEPAYKVCQSWDDYLYVFYNHVLLSRYQGFCKQFQRKLNHPANGNVAFLPEPDAYDEVRKFLETVKGHERISVEARNPYRTIQSAILCKDYDSFFVAFANAVSKVAMTSESDLVPDLSPTHVEDSALIAAKDQDSLRIATHLYVIAKSLGYARADSHFSQTAAVTLIGYIDFLQKVHLVDLIASYASLLPAPLAHSVLARVLIDVVDPKERKIQARSMHKHKIDMQAVLRTQWEWVLSDAMQVEDVNSTIRLSKSVRGGDGYKELAPVKKNFVGKYVSPEDERTIRCLEWHRYLEDQWQRICQLGTLLYKRFYASGSLAAARELSRRMRLSDISREILGIDVADVPLLDEDGAGIPASEPASPVKTSPSKKSSRSKNQATNGLQSRSRQAIMYEQSQMMREFERLILVFDALEDFAVTYEDFEQNKTSGEPTAVHELRNNLQVLLDQLTEHINYLCDDWLIQARDELEETQLEYIRSTYLPEVFLYYHNALYFAGHSLSGEFLVECVNLSTVIAGNPSLTSSFVSAGRMCELVDALALSSTALVNTPTPKNKKKLAHGARFDIWKIKLEGDDPTAIFRQP